MFVVLLVKYAKPGLGLCLAITMPDFAGIAGLLLDKSRSNHTIISRRPIVEPSKCMHKKVQSIRFGMSVSVDEYVRYNVLQPHLFSTTRYQHHMLDLNVITVPLSKMTRYWISWSCKVRYIWRYGRPSTRRYTERVVYVWSQCTLRLVRACKANVVDLNYTVHIVDVETYAYSHAVRNNTPRKAITIYLTWCKHKLLELVVYIG
jgi:hypothetical protein